MPKIKVKWQGLSTRNVNNQIRKRIEKRMRIAVRAWIKTAESHIPVWSGASRATLKKLAQDVGVQISGIPGPGSGRRGPPAESGGVTLGEARSSGDFEINFPKFTFKYRTNLWHLVQKETNGLNKAPLNFRVAADEAFKQALRLDNIIPNNIIKRKKIS